MCANEGRDRWYDSVTDNRGVNSNAAIDEIAYQRLLTRASVVGKQANPSECIEALLNYFATLDTGQADESASAYESVRWQLEQLLFDVNQVHLVEKRCDQEMREYSQLHGEMDESIVQVMRDIEGLKSRLIQERTLRGYKEEYESIARVVSALPSRKKSSAAIDEQREVLRVSQQQRDQATARLDTRSKQFDLLIRTIHDLQKTLQEDVRNEHDM